MWFCLWPHKRSFGFLLPRLWVPSFFITKVVTLCTNCVTLLRLRLVSHRSHLWHKFCKECHPSCHIIFCCACLEPFLEYIYSRSRLAWIFLASPDTTLLFWHCYSLSHNWVRQLFPCLTPIHFKRDPLGISSLFERHTVSFIEFWSKNTSFYWQALGLLKRDQEYKWVGSDRIMILRNSN